MVDAAVENIDKLEDEITRLQSIIEDKDDVIAGLMSVLIDVDTYADKIRDAVYIYV